MKANMKTLLVALAGLSSFAVAGAAFADCVDGNLSAWSAPSFGGGDSAVHVVAGGYDGSACKMAVNLGDNGTAHGQVRDDSPNNETRYRAQFIFDPVNLNAANGTNQSIIFLANSNLIYKNRLALVKMLYSGSGGGTKRVFIIGACDNDATQNQCQAIVTLPNQTGPNRIEVDLTVGANGVGALRYWVNDAATTGLLDASGISIPLTGGNAGWVGVKTVFMGMSTPTLNFRSAVAGNGQNVDKVVFFDQFDSRRQTFIGH
jgi:hypothetical protein